MAIDLPHRSSSYVAGCLGDLESAFVPPAEERLLYKSGTGVTSSQRIPVLTQSAATTHQDQEWAAHGGDEMKVMLPRIATPPLRLRDRACGAPWSRSAAALAAGT